MILHRPPTDDETNTWFGGDFQSLGMGASIADLGSRISNVNNQREIGIQTCGIKIYCPTPRFGLATAALRNCGATLS